MIVEFVMRTTLTAITCVQQKRTVLKPFMSAAPKNIAITLLVSLRPMFFRKYLKEKCLYRNKSHNRPSIMLYSRVIFNPYAAGG